MVLDMKQVPIKHSTTWGSSVLAFLRQHPIASYFLLAFGFTWGWQVPLFAVWHQPILGPWVILGPTLAGLVMAGITEGRAGMAGLLRRVVRWRVGIRWYLVALLISPAIWLVSVALMPGAVAAFRLPSPSFLLIWLAGFGFAFLSSTFVEEVGWRGFALPRLQGLRGPLVGSVILGALHALWHLPAWAFFPSSTGAGTSFLSFTFAITFLGFVCEIVAFAIIYTWVFNHTRGSILLAIVLHASGNASAGSFLALFPALFPYPVIPTAFQIGVVAVAVLIVVATRGRLGYDYYLRETALPTAESAIQPRSSPATAL